MSLLKRLMARLQPKRIAPMEDDLYERAYAAFDTGRLSEASVLFGRLLEGSPDAAHLHYMKGLTHKYLRDWPASLQHNLRSLELNTGHDEASSWNAAIAATAMGDWEEARRQWNACGIDLPGADGPIEGDFGTASIRLNPWDKGETLYARRIDPVRARLNNVPLPDSGFRFGDIVLHDGAKTGERRFRDRNVPVFNALQRLHQSDFLTHAVFVRCESQDDIDALYHAEAPGLGLIEDWTAMSHYCLRCSYGAPHKHEAKEDRVWNPERNLGIAAQGRAVAERVMKAWADQGRGRVLQGIEQRDEPLKEPTEGHAWWRDPAEQ